jgi:hypothetical protein
VQCFKYKYNARALNDMLYLRLHVFRFFPSVCFVPLFVSSFTSSFAYYCFRYLLTLDCLKARLESKGFRAILFFMFLCFTLTVDLQRFIETISPIEGAWMGFLKTCTFRKKQPRMFSPLLMFSSSPSSFFSFFFFYFLLSLNFYLTV